jgi:hypothetical protein
VKKLIPYAILVLACSLLITLVGCGDEAKIEEKKLVDVMCDVMLMEAGNQIEYNYANLPDSLWNSHYDFVCKKHGISKEDLKAELLRLKADPEAFTLLMEKVITQMQMAELKARKDNS